MPYAIVQNTLAPPSREQLITAFRALPELTDYDAATMAKDAFGILVDRLPMAKAGRLLQALHAAGVEAEMVDHDSLPPLPAASSIRRADLTDQAFVAYDVHDRPDPVAWSDILLIAAGAVKLTEFERVVTERISYRYVGDRSMPVVEYEHNDKAENVVRMRLDLFLGVEPGRYQIAAEKFSFDTLGPRPGSHTRASFAAFVVECARRAPQAVLNRGALGLTEDATRLAQYPSRHAFEEESVWQLWRHYASQRGSDTSC